MRDRWAFSELQYRSAKIDPFRNDWLASIGVSKPVDAIAFRDSFRVPESHTFSRIEKQGRSGAPGMPQQRNVWRQQTKMAPTVLYRRLSGIIIERAVCFRLGEMQAPTNSYTETAAFHGFAVVAITCSKELAR
jgi:hypothetical protein